MENGELSHAFLTPKQITEFSVLMAQCLRRIASAALTENSMFSICRIRANFYKNKILGEFHCAFTFVHYIMILIGEIELDERQEIQAALPNLWFALTVDVFNTLEASDELEVQRRLLFTQIRAFSTVDDVCKPLVDVCLFFWRSLSILVYFIGIVVGHCEIWEMQGIH